MDLFSKCPIRHKKLPLSIAHVNWKTDLKYISIIKINTNQKKVGEILLISYKMDFKTRNVTRYKGKYFKMVKWSIHQENIIVMIDHIIYHMINDSYIFII